VYSPVFYGRLTPDVCMCPRNANKVRVVALYIQHREGVPDEDRRRLYQHARLSLAEQDAVNALVELGVRISRVSGVLVWTAFNEMLNHVQGPGDRDSKKKIKQKVADDEYELSRYKPLLKAVVEVRKKLEHFSAM